MTILGKLNRKLGKEAYSSINKILEGNKETHNLKEENVNKAISNFDRSIPFPEDRQKWLEEERIERNKGTAQEFYDFRKTKKDNKSEWEPIIIKKMEELKKINGGEGKSYEDVKELFKLNNNIHEDILYKKSFDITESEINNAKRYSWYESKNKELNQKLDNKISSWYDDFYGKGKSSDATGRTVRPEIKTPFLSEPKPLKTPDGIDIKAAFSRVAEAASKNSDGPRTLQGALNSYDFDPKLKLDGDIGPKTTSRAKEGLMNYGVKDVVERIEKQEHKPVNKNIEEKEERDLDGNVVV